MGERPVRLQLSRKRGFNLQVLSLATNGLAAVNVTRNGPFGGRFGNPWKIGAQPGFSRQMVVSLHRTWITCQASDADVGEQAAEHRRLVLSSLDLIRGYNLACTCPLPAPYGHDECHASALIEVANPPPEGDGG